MPVIRLTNECMDAIRRASIGNGFRQTGTRRADGDWDLSISEELRARLETIRLQGETISDVIHRVVSTPN